MKAASPRVSRYVTEDENFWKKHWLDFSNSGLSKSTYCKTTGVNYHRFVYWAMKLSEQRMQPPVTQKKPSQQISQLLPVQLKQEPKQSGLIALCSLSLKSGSMLQIHDQQTLAFILEKVL